MPISNPEHFSFNLFALHKFYLFTATGYCSEDKVEGDESDEDMAILGTMTQCLRCFRNDLKVPLEKYPEHQAKQHDRQI